MEKAKEVMPLFREEVEKLNLMYQRYSSQNITPKKKSSVLAGIKIRLKQIRSKIDKLGKKYNVVMAHYRLQEGPSLYRFYTNIHIGDAKKIFDLDLKELREHVVELSFTEIEPGKNFSP